MHYNIKGTGVTVSDELRSYVEKKLGTLEKFVSDLEAARVDVELQFEALFNGPKYRAEFMFGEPSLHTTLRVEARGEAMHEAIDIAAGELFHSLTQLKKKRLQVFRRTAVKVKEYLRGWRDKV